MSARLDDTLDCENSSSLLNAQVPGKISEQIERLLAHQLFQHSDSNRQLVAYLGKRAIDHPGQPVKEIELAREVFGLSPDKFDPQVDSTVRVRIGRLRTKLLEYYASAGIDDEVLLEIPKGSYCLISHFRTKEPTAHVHSEPPPAELPSIPYAIMETAPASTKSKTQGRMILILVLALGALLGAVATHLIERQRSKRMPAHLDQFWTSFYNAQQPLTIVYSNPRLSGHLWTDGLHYADQGEAPRPDLSLNLTYTGSGDVPAVRALTHLFDQIQWDFRLESGAHLSWDAARASNLIFLGRPEQNPALQQLSRLSEFYFQTGRGIINAHPQSGESERYSSDSEYDYAVIAFTPGMDSKRNMLVLAGTLTEGTRAAVDCLTDESCIATLLNKLGVQKGSKVPYFEALLKVKINNNTPVWSSIITVHPYNADPSSWQVPAVHER